MKNWQVQMRQAGQISALKNDRLKQQGSALGVITWESSLRTKRNRKAKNNEFFYFSGTQRHNLDLQERSSLVLRKIVLTSKFQCFLRHSQCCPRFTRSRLKGTTSFLRINLDPIMFPKYICSTLESNCTLYVKKT